MSNLIEINQLPSYLQGYESDSVDSLVTGGIVLPRISLRGKQFRFKKDDKERAMPLGAPLNVVIMGASPRKGFSKAYYEEAYKEGSDDMPSCSSSGGVIPDAWCETKQAKTCAACPHNVFGSNVDSKGNPTKGKACADTKQLLVLAPDQPDGELWMIRVPPASLRHMSDYASELKRHRLPIEGVITQIYFMDAEFPKIGFKFQGFINDAYAMKFIERVKSEEFKTTVDQLSGEGSIQAGGEVQPQQAASQPQQATEQAAPNTQDDGTDAIWFSDQGANPTSSPIKAVHSSETTRQTVNVQEGVQTPGGAAPQTTGRDPKRAVQAPDGSYYVDEYGTAFNPQEHATKTGCSAGSLNKDGSFKAKRGATSKPKTVEPENTPTPGNQQSVFSGGGSTSGFGFGDESSPASQTQQSDQGSDEDDLQSILDDWG